MPKIMGKRIITAQIKKIKKKLMNSYIICFLEKIKGIQKFTEVRDSKVLENNLRLKNWKVY